MKELDQLMKLANQIKGFVRQPRALGAVIEEHSPWLSRRFLGAASNLAEPFVAGMGLGVETLGEESIEVSMPGFWRNQGEGGKIHPGALCTLGEFATRIFWEHHLDLRRSEMTVRRIHLRALSNVEGGVRALYRLSVSEREKLLHALRAEGAVDVECEVAIHDAGGKLAAQVEVEWRFAKPLALGPGSGS